MHNGNLSFFCAGEKLLGLTQIYDMLPTRCAPLNEEVIQRTFSPKVAPPNDRAIANAAGAAAVQYWKLIASDMRVSVKFRAIATENTGVVSLCQVAPRP